jgi:hypothetical protein
MKEQTKARAEHIIVKEQCVKCLVRTREEDQKIHILLRNFLQSTNVSLVPPAAWCR